jgi:cysteine desulfurase
MEIYLDHNASSPMPPEVAQALLAVLESRPGNPSSRHAAGVRARQVLEQARAGLAHHLGARPSEITLTSGGTESNNLALHGLLGARAPRRRLIVAATEHPSVIKPAQALARQGAEAVVLPVDPCGRVSPADLARALTPDTALVAIMLANNETGVLQDVPALAELCTAQGVPLHCDAVQAVGKIPIQLPDLGATTVSFTAHKLGGPIGIGALWVSRRQPLAAQQLGGDQEHGRRAGTEPFALAHAFAAALELAVRDLAVDSARVAGLRDRLERAALDLVPSARVLGGQAARLPNTTFIAFPGRDGGELAAELDARGLRVATGSACGAHDRSPSQVALAMGLSPDEAQGTLRFSLSRLTTADEVGAAVEALGAVL